jgi:hypothetical protein
MDTLSAFAMGQANRGKEPMFFDWIKAATIIVERGAKEASAGLAGDWEWTGGPILKNGKPVRKEDTYTYLASTWATPQLEVDGDLIDCFVMKSKTDGWDSETYWPDEALEILNRRA